MTLTAATARPVRRSRFRAYCSALHYQVLAAILAGVIFGFVAPSHAVALKPVSDGFIKILRMMLPPIIFTTVAAGIGSTGNLRKVGRLGLKALVYFEAVTTLALVIGLIVVHGVKPGAGMNVDPRTLDASTVSAYAQTAAKLSVTDYLLGIIPQGMASPFADGDILQALFVGVAFGLALAHVGHSADVLHRGLNQLSAALFAVVGYLMRLAPLAAMAAMAFTVGQYGVKSLVALATLVLCFYLTGLVFVFAVLGIISRAAGVGIWKFLKYIKEELLVVLGTSTSEPVLPSLILKLERLGCSKTIAGFVVPAGYTFNLDGSSIYLTMAFVFIAQATNTPLTWSHELFVLGIMLLTSKGSAGVPGSGFVALAATLSAVHSVPMAGLALLLGIDRFMSQVRALINVIGNGVATIVVARWEGEFDVAKAQAILNGKENNE
jgi:aerobic C4-dicarboxylate transport protein